MKAIGERLRLTREALGRNQIEFAKLAKISASAYNQYEKGRIRPSVDAAIAMVDAHKITLDWIFLGDNSGLRANLKDAIAALRLSRD